MVGGGRIKFSEGSYDLLICLANRSGICRWMEEIKGMWSELWTECFGARGYKVGDCVKHGGYEGSSIRVKVKAFTQVARVPG